MATPDFGLVVNCFPKNRFLIKNYTVKNSYLSAFSGYYFTGDGDYMGAEGCTFITGPRHRRPECAG